MMFLKPKKTLLTVSIDGNEICRVTNSKLSIEKQVTVEIGEEGADLVFEDSYGIKTTHSLAKEKGWFAFSIRVHPNMACQADCIYSKDKAPSRKRFSNGELSGIRFQPFFIDEAKDVEKKLKGHGLFQRGLHFSGTITPGNVSLSCICDVCRKSFRLQSFHAGFSNYAYMYSDSGKYTITMSEMIEGAPPVLGKADVGKLQILEDKLPKAPDGTLFRYMNPLRCPHCSEPYIDFEQFPKEREIEYYGNTFFGESTIHFEPE